MSLLGLFATYEMLKCANTLKCLWISIPSFVLCVSAPIFARILDSIDLYIRCFVIAVLAVMIYFFSLGVLRFGKISLNDITVSFMTILYIATALGALVLLRNQRHGSYYLVLAFVAPAISDIFAYFIGKAIGKHKLIPDVSPKKTVEGAIAGIVFTIIFCVAYAYIVSAVYNTELKPNLLGLILVGIVLSLTGQLGDLITSSIKRVYGIKDFGNLLPGHGGVLDRFDSIFSTGFIVFLFTMLPESFDIFKF